MAGRAFSVKMGGGGRGVASTRTDGASASIIVACTTKSRMMMARNNIDGYHPVGAPTCKQEVGKPSQNTVRKTDKLWKGWGFRVGTWNIDSLTSRAGAFVKALAERKIDATDRSRCRKLIKDV